MIYRNSKIRKNPNNNNNMYPWLVDTIYYCYPDLTYTVILFFTSNRINHFSFFINHMQVKFVKSF